MSVCWYKLSCCLNHRRAERLPGSSAQQRGWAETVEPRPQRGDVTQPESLCATTMVGVVGVCILCCTGVPTQLCGSWKRHFRRHGLVVETINCPALKVLSGGEHWCSAALDSGGLLWSMEPGNTQRTVWKITDEQRTLVMLGYHTCEHVSSLLRVKYSSGGNRLGTSHLYLIWIMKLII